MRGERAAALVQPLAVVGALLPIAGVWDRNELYDLTADPEEQMNLIDVPLSP